MEIEKRRSEVGMENVSQTHKVNFQFRIERVKQMIIYLLFHLFRFHAKFMRINFW
jgi:hypothetical protein